MTLVSEVEIAPVKRYSSFMPSLEDEGQSCSVLEPERVISNGRYDAGYGKAVLLGQIKPSLGKEMVFFCRCITVSILGKLIKS